MASTFDDFLASFDRLPIADQERAAKEIWKRMGWDEIPKLDDAALIALADELFQMEDKREQENGTAPTEPW